MTEPSEDSVINTKSRLLDIFSKLDSVELNAIENWICSNAYKTDLEIKRNIGKMDQNLIKIGKTIKKIVPLEAEMHSEIIKPPKVGDQADCNEFNTYHIDEFLYDEDEVDKLVDKGKIKRHYCVECNSYNIKDLIFISHSMSRPVVEYIFKVLLPKNLFDKQILDIGSRIGAVLYGAYYFSNAGTIVGVEINKECCDIQERIIDQYSLDTGRVKVIHSDIMNCSDLISKSNIVILNVLDFFVDTEKHREIWYFFKKHMSKGSLFIVNRSMADTWNSLEIFEEFIDWLSICRPNQLENELFFNLDDCSELFMYSVN